MTDRELLQQALEALENVAANYGDFWDDIIATLRERLAQPEQDGTCSHCDGAGCVACDARYLPQQEPVAVPVAFITDGGKGELWWSRSVDENGNNNMDDIPLYTTPPRREWVGLTREDVLNIEENTNHPLEFYRAIEAKLKEKNA